MPTICSNINIICFRVNHCSLVFTVVIALTSEWHLGLFYNYRNKFSLSEVFLRCYISAVISCSIFWAPATQAGSVYIHSMEGYDTSEESYVLRTATSCWTLSYRSVYLISCQRMSSKKDEHTCLKHVYSVSQVDTDLWPAKMMYWIFVTVGSD